MVETGEEFIIAHRGGRDIFIPGCQVFVQRSFVLQVLGIVLACLRGILRIYANWKLGGVVTIILLIGRYILIRIHNSINIYFIMILLYSIYNIYLYYNLSLYSIYFVIIF